ncbi:HEAT repeat domain-containing protein [Cellvibrio sp. KY-GH-1]|uniref:HEAT repeat domain-containing protein n=1 Tax=Cellvibrio sp. KY-GH-1 TaxID=2303332 RepID=UPI0012456224|nr:HEAT repeat domain-containing protein [Cellvibrio sp. KY-GH-1]QEY17575.1 HEAT repeat domain-containing protein [Cellvibrio sp. KY-GH-1]
MNTIRNFSIPALAGALITYTAVALLDDNGHQQAQLRQQVTTLENRILALESSLAQKDEALNRARAFARFEQQLPGVLESLEQAPTTPNNGPISLDEAAIQAATSEQTAEQKVRDLSTNSDRDPRPFSQKVQDLLAADASKANIAIASKGIFDMADNRESLPNQELEAVYYGQTDPELKRVAAQTLSLRGDNSLLDKQINDAQPGLRSDDPAQRQRTLVDLAKTRYAGAADLIAPLLEDKDTGVKLDALLALRATGNQRHIHLVEALANHPDPAVSWLAQDVIANLQNLSEKARTRIATSDIGAELPFLGVQ